MHGTDHDVGAPRGAVKLVVLTGGPGGGKTAVLEIARKHFCEHVVVLPEAATILFGGGFPRGVSAAARRAAQRAIFRIQIELETMAIEEGRAAVVLCDRGTIDGIAYWPDEPEGFWRAVGTTHALELIAAELPERCRPDAKGAPLESSNQPVMAG